MGIQAASIQAASSAQKAEELATSTHRRTAGSNAVLLTLKRQAANFDRTLRDALKTIATSRDQRLHPTTKAIKTAANIMTAAETNNLTNVISSNAMSTSTPTGHQRLALDTAGNPQGHRKVDKAISSNKAREALLEPRPPILRLDRKSHRLKLLQTGVTIAAAKDIWLGNARKSEGMAEEGGAPVTPPAPPRGRPRALHRP